MVMFQCMMMILKKAIELSLMTGDDQNNNNNMKTENTNLSGVTDNAKTENSDSKY